MSKNTSKSSGKRRRQRAMNPRVKSNGTMAKIHPNLTIMAEPKGQETSGKIHPNLVVNVTLKSNGTMAKIYMYEFDENGGTKGPRNLG